MRAQIAHEAQLPGPAVSSGDGGGGSTVPGGVPDLRLSSEFSDTWRLKRGPFVTRTYGVPVNYMASDGLWHPIDTSLVSGLGGYENAANSFSLRLPESLSAGVSLSKEGDSVAFTLLGATTAPAAIAGSTATYHEVLPSTDLSYVSRADGVEELATLKDAKAPSRLVYQLSASGLTPRQEVDGSIALRDAQGATRFLIPAPVAYPSSTGPATGKVLPMSLSASGANWSIGVDTGQAWLRAALVGGSVVVDPSVKSNAGISCGLVAESPKESFCERSTFQVGYDTTHKENHALVNINAPSVPLGAIVLDASFGDKLISHSTSTAKGVGVYRVTRPWTYSFGKSTTWETYDGTHAWTTPGGDYSNPSENSDASVLSSVGAANGWYVWPITKMVQEWVNGPNAPVNEGQEVNGLLIKDETDNKTPNLLTFNGAGVSEGAYFEVIWRPRGEGNQPQYTQLSTPLTDRSSMSVNIASGNLMIEAQDMQIAGVAGLDFNTTRTWNSIGTDLEEEYGQWSDSNYNMNRVWTSTDGNLSIENPTGAWVTFIHQSNASFITPPGIKALMCEAGSPPPCPSTLPSGTKYRLIYNESGDYVNYGAEGLGSGVHDRFGNVISVEYGKTSGKTYTDTHGHKIEVLQNKEFYVTEIKDVSGARNTKYTYELAGEAAFLKSYTDANGKLTKYGYAGAGPGNNSKRSPIPRAMLRNSSTTSANASRK